MKITEENIASIRGNLLALAGLSCLLYAGMAVAANRPDPFWWFVPGVMGLIAGAGTTLAFMMATPNVRRMANDELYQQTMHRAQRHAFWIAMALYPVSAIAVVVFGLRWDTIFAVMGTLTGAAYLLLLTFYEWRQK